MEKSLDEVLNLKEFSKGDEPYFVNRTAGKQKYVEDLKAQEEAE